MAVITQANMETDLRMASALDQALTVLLADTSSIMDLDFGIVELAPINGLLTDTIRERQVALDADNFSATGAEDTDASAGTAITDDGVNIAVVRAALAREISDLGLMGASATDLDPEALAASLVRARARYTNTVVATAAATASSTVGSSTSGCTADDILDAQFALQEAYNPLPFYCGLHQHQLTGFQNSLRGEMGALGPFNTETVDMLKAKNTGEAGTWNGIRFATFSQVIAASSIRKGAMWSAGALGVRKGIPTPNITKYTQAVAIVLDNLLIEIQHVFGGGKVRVAGDIYLGASLREQARIVGIFTQQ